MFQSTRPRGARPKCGRSLSPMLSVSIHAPARGATCARRLLQGQHPVSIHAPARGATSWPRSATARSASFNPRARAGRDSVPYDFFSSFYGFQSTRPRGARHFDDDCKTAHPSGFNPRARAGRDFLWRSLRVQRIWFQSTRPRGARPDEGDGGEVRRMFQSTRPRGARLSRAQVGRIRRLVSIHAPARGATATVMTLGNCSITFQSTRPRGARQVGGLSAAVGLEVSIHAPARGATSMERCFPSCPPVSIHAPARGATRRSEREPLRLPGFNPRARAGRDSFKVISAREVYQFQSTRPRGARREVPRCSIR